MPRDFLVDPKTIDLNVVADDIEGIRKYNRQRYEMEQLTAIVRFDPERGIVIGYKDVTNEEFWVRGHIPGRPLMPGAIMIEAAAQLCSYYYSRSRQDGRFIGFGGVDGVRFRGIVEPGARFVIVAKNVEMRERIAIFETQGLVGEKLVFEARIIGVPL